jgi:hypothetical protein
LERLLDGYDSNPEEEDTHDSTIVQPVHDTSMDESPYATIVHSENNESDYAEIAFDTMQPPDRQAPSPPIAADESVIEVESDSEQPIDTPADMPEQTQQSRSIIASEHELSDMWNWRLTESERQLGKVCYTCSACNNESIGETILDTG